MTCSEHNRQHITLFSYYILIFEVIIIFVQDVTEGINVTLSKES